jgi:uncharacterized protein (TIGR02246 family)
MESDLRGELRELAARVTALEDELEIHRLLVRYGFAVDTDDVEAMLELFTDDTTIHVDGKWEMHGHQEAREIVEGPVHQGYLPNCAHNIGPLVVDVAGNHAVATGYSRVYLRVDGDFKVERVSFNRWELERRAGRWQIATRHTALLGAGEVSHDLLQRGLR